MVKLKEYAAKAGVSTEMIRQQTHTYKKQLGEHLIYQKGSYYLDDDGVAILDGIRQKTSPRAKIQAQEKEIQELREAVGALLERINIAEKPFRELRKTVLNANLGEKDLYGFFPLLKNYALSEWQLSGDTCISTNIADLKYRGHPENAFAKMYLYEVSKFPDGPPIVRENQDCFMIHGIDGSEWHCVMTWFVKVEQLAMDLGVSTTEVVSHIQQLGIEKDIARLGPQKIMAINGQQKALISKSFAVRYDTPVSPEKFSEMTKTKRETIFTGQAAQQVIQWYIPNAIGKRQVTKVAIWENGIRVTVADKDGQSIWVDLGNTAHRKEPTGKYDTVTATDGSTWYRVAQRYTKSAQQPQTVE